MPGKSNSNILYTSSGQIDRRCSAARSGEITFNNDGNIRANCAMATECGLTSSGALDKRSSAARGPQSYAIQEQSAGDLRIPSKISNHRDTHHVADGKDVDHLLSCTVANTLVQSKKGSTNQNEVAEFKTIINSSNNLRAVDSHTNRSTNNKLDNQIIEAHTTGDFSNVSKAGIHRAQVASNSIQKASEGFDNSLVNHAVKQLDNIINKAKQEQVE